MAFAHRLCAHTRTGFTLLEMSIVLTIIGLLAASVLVGQNLIRAAQLRSVISEYDGYLKAIKEFQDKYLALPGDYSGATTIWATDTTPSGCPNTLYNTVLKAATCNGDGNGHVGDSDANATLTNSYEWFRAWQHLYDAGLIPTMLTGAPGNTTATEAIPGVNVPASQLPGAGWTLNYYLFPSNGSADTGGLWRDRYGHLLNLGAFTSGNYTKNPIMSASEAYDIDQKVDDGVPGTGRVRAWRTSVLANCTNEIAQSSSTYNISSTNAGNTCSLVFLLGF